MNHYETLGLAPSADPIVIKAAYRALSQRYHSDKCTPAERQNAHRRMAQINAAFQVLGDVESRKHYDDLVKRGSAQARPLHATAAGLTIPRRSISPARLRIAILVVTALIAFAYGVETKPWWRWSWEFFAGGFEPTSRYVLHWPLIAITLSIGAWIASRAGRASR